MEYPDAQHNLGVMYDFGKGTTQSYTEAFKWYKKAASNGHILSSRNIGAMYLEGEGVKKSKTDAIYWFRIAAKQNDSEAIRILEVLDSSIDE